MNNIKRKKLLRDPLSLGELKINGNDIKNLNLIDNKNIGKILNHLLTEVLNNPKLNKKEILIKKIKDQYLQHF